mmetsp:Transcript_3267/g.8347  ORF Transcript_3267/g.8347 Transcript_3267/m.8347 type:complete len:240 (+) Transcript_3267:954-1673(+)
MGQHAALCRDLMPGDHRVQQLQQAHHLGQVVGGGVDADDRVARAHQQAVEQAGGDAGLVVGRVVGLQPRGQPAAPAERAAEARDHLAALGDQQQVLHAAELGDGGGHLGRQARGDLSRVDRAGQQGVAQAANGQVGDGCEGSGVVGVDDKPGDLVGLVGHDGLAEKALQRQLGQRELSGHALAGVGSGHAGQLVARAARAGFGQQGAQVGKAVALTAEGLGVGHGPSVGKTSGACMTKP